MDKTALVAEVAEMFRVAGHHVQIDVQINHRRIDIVASELQGIIRKKILVECAEYASGVGVDKIQEDYRKLQSARDFLKESCVFLHVSSVGYSPAASGWALEQGLSTHTLADLRTRLVNFEPYLSAMESDKLRNIILNEYQATTISIRQQRSGRNPIAIDYLSEWVRSSNRWLTLLGDYGVGKSWALKRLLYRLIDDFRNDPSSSPLPFFIPLQHFTKAFDYQNLLLATMQRYNLSGVPVEAFNYMARHGRIVFLLDSFDEMAQHLSRATIRSNLNELLVGIGVHSKAIMTSRPNYFENRSERLLFVEGVDGPQFHSIDDEQIARETILAKDLEGHLENSQVVRLNDLTPEQRRRLFRTVLGAESAGYRRLNNLFNRFQQLASISQRAVIARLLTTVAESLADPGQQMIDGESIIPEDLSELTQERIFRIILHNLLHRDRSIGDLNAGRRLLFLRSLAVRLQTKGREPFINPDELRQMIADLFSSDLRRTDTPESLLESYYRTCRRHSGLTTEGQFFDTSGRIDIPVEDTDNESRVGFSHNVLREFLVADAFADFIVTGQYYKGLDNVALSDTIIDFVYDRIRFIDNAVGHLTRFHINLPTSAARDLLFRLLLSILLRDVGRFMNVLGSPPKIVAVDLSGMDLTGLPLRDAIIEDCIAEDTDLRGSDIRGAKFTGCILSRVMLDGARIQSCDFRETDVESIYVFDDYDTRTTAVLKDRAARQWLFSHGATVSPDNDLNKLLGNPYYHAAREVARTLQRKIVGQHKEISLARGTRLEQRDFATTFVSFLIRKGALQVVGKADLGGGRLVKLKSEYWTTISEFAEQGLVRGVLEDFFAGSAAVREQRGQELAEESQNWGSGL